MTAHDAPAEPADQAHLTVAELRASYGDTTGKLASVGGAEVYYRDAGHGPVLLFIHGSACTSNTVDALVKLLVPHYRVIRYDIPGIGLSGPVSDDTSARLTPADIPIGLLDQLGIRKATVMAYSSGGTAAIALAAKRPDLVDRLILSDAPSDPVPLTGNKMSPALAAQVKLVEQTHYRSQAFWNAFLDFYAGVPDRFSPDIRRQFYDMNRRTPDKNSLRLVATVADHAAALQRMAGVHAPTLLIWGAKDELLPPPAAATLAGYLKNALVSTVFLPDVGHFPPVEVPDRYAAIMTTYLTAVAPPGTVD